MKWLLTMLCLFAFPVLAQEPCATDRDQVVEFLLRDYGETSHGYGLSTGNQIIELFANDETGTWTITAVYSSPFKMCIVLSGTDWTSFIDNQGGTGDRL